MTYFWWCLVSSTTIIINCSDVFLGSMALFWECPCLGGKLQFPALPGACMEWLMWKVKQSL